MPFQANKLRTKKREELNACNETSTFHNTYSGVPFRKTVDVPLIARADKAQIFRHAPGTHGTTAGEGEELPENWCHGATEPLFWQECKPISFWMALLNDLNAKAVFDLTPGSGALAEAAMAAGIQYHGTCRTPRCSHHLIERSSHSFSSCCRQHSIAA